MSRWFSRSRQEAGSPDRVSSPAPRAACRVRVSLPGRVPQAVRSRSRGTCATGGVGGFAEQHPDPRCTFAPGSAAPMPPPRPGNSPAHPARRSARLRQLALTGALWFCVHRTRLHLSQGREGAARDAGGFRIRRSRRGPANPGAEDRGAQGTYRADARQLKDLGRGICRRARKVPSGKRPRARCELRAGAPIAMRQGPRPFHHPHHRLHAPLGSAFSRAESPQCYK